MNDAAPLAHHHHHHLELARAQVIELLSRQAVERELLSRSAEAGERQDVVASLVSRQQQAQLEQRLLHFHPADIAFVLENLAPDARQMAWSLVRPERRGAVLLETTTAVQRSLMSDMRAEEVAAVVRPLDSGEIADLLSELPEELKQATLARLDRSDQVEVRSVLSFPEGSVGAVMEVDFIAVRADASLEAVHRLLRRRKQLPPHTTQIFVVNRENELEGLLALQKLLVEEPEIPVSEVMTPEPVYFFTDDPVKDAVAAFEKYDLSSAPVLNLHKQVVGRITVETVLNQVTAQQSSETLRQVGLDEDEDLFAPALQSGRKRWPWLGLNLLTAFFASRVVGAFEPIIAQIVALAALMPIVASIGGNTGNQTVALVIRRLAMDQLGPAQLRQMFRKELIISAINGTLWGTALAATTLLLYHNPALSLVIGAALLLNILVAAFIGMVTPVLLQRLGRDPVRGSSIILTFATDSMGFFIFLGLAAVFLV